MEKFTLIDFKTASNMCEENLQLEIQKRVEYLREELGMDRFEAANYISSLLNLGAALSNVFETKRSLKENKK